MSTYCKYPCQHLFPHSFSFLSNVLIFYKIRVFYKPIVSVFPCQYLPTM